MQRTYLAARFFLGVLVLTTLPACTAIVLTGAAVGTVAAVAVEVVELPFELAGAAYDLATDDEDSQGPDAPDQADVD